MLDVRHVSDVALADVTMQFEDPPIVTVIGSEAESLNGPPTTVNARPPAGLPESAETPVTAGATIVDPEMFPRRVEMMKLSVEPTNKEPAGVKTLSRPVLWTVERYRTPFSHTSVVLLSPETKLLLRSTMRSAGAFTPPPLTVMALARPIEFEYRASRKGGVANGIEFE